MRLVLSLLPFIVSDVTFKDVWRIVEVEIEESLTIFFLSSFSNKLNDRTKNKNKKQKQKTKNKVRKR